MNKTTIQSILVRPKREQRFIYYINENLDNGHYATRDEVYQVICEVVPIHIAQQALQLLRHYSTFIVDVGSQQCLEFDLDYEMALSEYRKANLQPSAEKALKQSKELDNNDNKWYISPWSIVSKLKKDVNR